MFEDPQRVAMVHRGPFLQKESVTWLWQDFRSLTWTKYVGARIRELRFRWSFFSELGRSLSCFQVLECYVLYCFFFFFLAVRSLRRSTWGRCFPPLLGYLHSVLTLRLPDAEQTLRAVMLWRVQLWPSEGQKIIEAWTTTV